MYHPNHRLRPVAFTLFELLIVISVLSMLFVVAAPSLFNSSVASHLTTTGDLVLGKLSEAQQEAIARNSEVEVRFFEEVANAELDPTPRLRSFQLLTMAVADESGSEGGYLPATPVTHFARGIVISGKENLSSLIQAGFKSVEAATGTRYLSFRFLPDGSTSLSEGAPWFLTLVSEVDEAQEDIPPNFYTLQIDPVTGRIRSFRP